MNKYKLNIINTHNFEVSINDNVLGQLDIENNNNARIKVLDNIYTITKIKGSILLGIKFQIVSNKVNKRYNFSTRWFGLGGHLLYEGEIYKFYAGGGGVQTWHEWKWNKNNKLKNSILISARAEERNSSFNGEDKILVKGDVSQELCVLLILLTRFFYFSYIGGK